MTHQEYIKQNSLGFEGDTFIGKEIKKLVNKHKIDLIVETGTFYGATSNRLVEFAPVYTIEVNNQNYRQAVRNLKKGIVAINGNSVTELKNLLPVIKEKNILFFLDAHWGDYWPLLDELKVIAENKLKPVIIIHDFKVPDKDFGYDTYKGVPLDLNYIHEGLKSIYGEYKYHYNKEADGAKRGVIYVYK